MRLLFVNYESPPLGGGGGVACQSVARALAHRNEIHVLTSGTPGIMAAELADGVHVWRAAVPGRCELQAASLLSLLAFYPAGMRLGAALCRRLGFDLVVSWFVVPSGTVGARLARRFGLRHAISIMGGDVFEPTMWYAPPRNPLLSPLLRRLLDGADLRIAPSRDLVRKAQRLHGVAEPIEVIPHGMAAPPGLAPTGQRGGDGKRYGAVELVSIARLVKRKRVDRLLQALAALSGLDVQLTLVGDGPERRRLEALAAALGVAGRVRFLGHVDEVAKRRALAAADLFVLASAHEGFGLVYLEAMQHGLPVVAASAGGQADFLEDGRTGALVPNDDVVALAAAIGKLAGDPALRQRVAEECRERAAALTADATAAAYERAFTALVARKERTLVKADVAAEPAPAEGG
jgi:glycosyltransferase involved in cell wall biosynthesis